MSQLLVDGIKDRPGTGGPQFTKGLHMPAGIGITGAGHVNVSGACTFSGNVTIGGTLTYEDVTNIDSVGIVTARAGINMSGGQLLVGTGVTIGVAGIATFRKSHIDVSDALNNSGGGQGVFASLTTGVQNTAIGGNALTANTTGGTNTGVGYAALDANTTGNGNVAVGLNALGAKTTASYKTSLL